VQDKKRSITPEERHFGSVWFIPGENRGRYPFCHSVYIEGAGILIDPASNRERLKEIRDNPGVREVWLTHWHEDHIMHLDLFEHLPLSVSGPDAPPLEDLERFLDAYGMDQDEERRFWKAILQDTFHFRPRRPARVFKGGEVLGLGSVTVEVLHTPGHTPGHLSFFFVEPEVLLLGDYDLTTFGPWYGDVGSSVEETIRSVTTLKGIPAKVWIASHETGLFMDPPGSLWGQYLEAISRRENDLLRLLEVPQTLDEIVGAWIMYGRPREPKAFFEFGERAHMKKHLERLMRSGAVAVTDGRYVRARA
jgi:glyoxylase-like metal-dependent hydrolase (beta-lactamase superfamily II)